MHARVDALASEMGADRSPAEDYILGGADAPEVAADPRYPASESYRPLEQQPLAQQSPRRPEKKSGWGFFGRKKAPDLRTEPAPEPRAATAPRATAQTMQGAMPPMPQQTEAPRNNAEDLFPDHKRDEQFEIPAFLRRQSN